MVETEAEKKKEEYQKSKIMNQQRENKTAFN